MTKEQEDKIIAHAQDILEKRNGVENDIAYNMRLNYQNVFFYGAYYLGALIAVKKVVEELVEHKPKGEDWIYLEAIWDLITKDKRSMQLFLDGQEMRYRNHKRNKKGNLESVECYFVESRNVIMEVK